MVRKPSALAGIFDDEPETAHMTAAVSPPEAEPVAHAITHDTRKRKNVAPTKRSSHPGKKPVLIHIPEDMHRTLRQLSVEEGGEPLTVITERLLRQYLVKRGHTKFAP
ncbi:hypothetical protein PK98_15565 [Croceibacterium mercuriale]|uniref:Uncharacterized protein n=2 Tax=Croceibacterium mercuriale TaxID=1572751 RepID=A0A0B2BWC8_9SPHN|nr:hypothetical protein PK98_15565 [Croceibacterium mercuriale]